MAHYRSARIYDLALQRVASGRWRVDPDQGIVYGEKGQPLRGKRTTDGYRQLSFRHGGSHVTPLAHVVIWEAVHGPKPKGAQLNHINGVKHDNRISNLELVTCAENIAHARRTGLNKPNYGEASGTHKLTAAAVRDIRAAFAAGASNSELARRYGVWPETIRNVRRGLTWKQAA